MQNTPMNSPFATVYGIPACDTVKKARNWLLAHGIEHDFHDFKKLGVPPQKLDRWITAVGWERLLNTRGTTWRKLDDRARADVVDAASARALMLAQVSVLKRPVVDWRAGAVTVGFDEADWLRRIA